jgi:hypothetical protein
MTSTMTPNQEPRYLHITVQVRDVYGTEKFYPICDDALRFAAIAGTTTLTQRVLKCVEALGYRINYTLRR